MLTFFNRVFHFTQWGTSPQTEWYYRGSFWDIFRVRAFGNFWFHTSVAIFYFVLTVPLPFGVVCEHKANPSEWASKHIEGIMAWLFIVLIGLPLFVWLERLKFEKWVKCNAVMPSQPHRDRFETNARQMENFWKAVGTLYVTAGIFSFQLKEPSVPTNAPGKSEFENLTTAVHKLAAAVASHSTGGTDTVRKESQNTEKATVKEEKEPGVKPPIPGAPQQ